MQRVKFTNSKECRIGLSKTNACKRKIFETNASINQMITPHEPSIDKHKQQQNDGTNTRVE
jgi:hypothetical protein